MKASSGIFYGNSPIQTDKKEISGSVIAFRDEEFYKISNYDQMPAFFMSIVSSSDHWMFISSTGGLTCGRKNPENALFPYYTDDKIHDSAETTGPLTILIIHQHNKSLYWKPFSKEICVYRIERNIYKSIYGNKVVFEEINHDLNLSFSYTWMNSDRYGFIRQSKIKNNNNQTVEVSLIDGLRNILPYGVDMGLQNTMSTLIDGYKQSELIENSGLAIYTLSSILTDRAEPSEALKSTVVWQQGISNAKYLLSEKQISDFTRGLNVDSESFIKGQRGCFFIEATISLDKKNETEWLIISNLQQGPSDVPMLIQEISEKNLHENIMLDVKQGTGKLHKLVSLADGLQVSNDKLISSRHFSNTLFNIMRGGIFYDEYTIPKEDFMSFVEMWNKNTFRKHQSLFTTLQDKSNIGTLYEIAERTEDRLLERLVLEYLPLMFSRRHGDPSRPWNMFSIDIKKSDGSDNLYYQGNWRDIFQNWEALALSYPEYIESFITKFVNASTADGYNPYRVTKDGIDWEILDPEDPWSNIGYWGDHQIVYLLKLMELSVNYHPGRLDDLLNKEIFAYANVPYRIKNYNALIQDPRNTIQYDENLAAKIDQRVKQTGSDGKLIQLSEGDIYHVSLLEKILVSALTKLYNFIPEGGIWMNTQRPEWNDANNALVGYGLSMVTLYYLRRYLNFLSQRIESSYAISYSISNEVRNLFDDINSVFTDNLNLLSNAIGDVERKKITDQLGKAGENYRINIYNGFSGYKMQINKDELDAFLQLSIKYIDHTIKLNKRDDGLFHAYNLIHFGNHGYQIEHLYEMLEGQVSVLSSGYLTATESLKLLDDLRNSNIYREDQNSYMLYPDKILPRFLQKNSIPKEKVQQIEWLKEQLDINKNDIIEQDINGQYHFNGVFRNSAELRSSLQKDTSIAYEEIEQICRLYEELFNHRKFTGRSGTFYKYEGLGCIYWHMVSKLLLAVQEVWCKALRSANDENTLTSLFQHYKELKVGIGLHKNPAEYGAFPIDPYSHTPSFTGAQQPGMTGQVKEDLIIRQGELGICVLKGIIHFKPTLLTKKEFSKQEHQWKYPDEDSTNTINLPRGSLGFSLYGVPVVYQISTDFQISIETNDGKTIHFQSFSLDRQISESLFKREGKIKKITVLIPAEQL